MRNNETLMKMHVPSVSERFLKYKISPKFEMKRSRIVLDFVKILYWMFSIFPQLVFFDPFL